MSRLMGVLMVCFLVVCSGLKAEDQYAHITQDRISVGCLDGEFGISFNEQSVSMEELKGRLTDSYSITLFFHDASIESILEVLQLVRETGVDDRLVTVMLRDENPPAGMHHTLEIQKNGELLFNGELLKVTDLSDRLSAGIPTLFVCHHQSSIKLIHDTMRAVASAGAPLVCSVMTNFGKIIVVEVGIVQIGDDDAEEVLSSPRVSTCPGNEAIIKVMSRRGDPADAENPDPHRQIDLGGHGARLSVLPQLIGEYIRVSGAAEISHVVDKKAVFKQGDETIYSYVVEKIVVPFSEVIPCDVEMVEIPVASANGKKRVCRLSVSVEKDSGRPRMTRGAGSRGKPGAGIGP